MASVDTQLNQTSDVVLMDAVVADLIAIRAAIVAITAQLDADAGVTDTDYAENNDPEALTTTT
jgi:hypothetical protein